MIDKIGRIFIATSLFLCVVTLMGLQSRDSHHVLLLIIIPIISGLLLKNIWATLFLWWTSFLFMYFKTKSGPNYINTIFYTSMFYLAVKTFYKREHIDFFLKILLWVGVVNLLYGIAQVMGYDFIYNGLEHLTRSKPDSLLTQAPNGFMGNTGVASFFYASLIPIFATRSRYWWLSAIFFIPLFFLHSSANFVAGVIGFMFVAFYRMKRKAWIALASTLILSSFLFIAKVDPIGKERFDCWKLVMSDCAIHPVTGWGLDSFRNATPWKGFIYIKDPKIIRKGHATANSWDNPHNLLISLMFEFGIVGVLLFFGYLRELLIHFKRSIKEPNVIGLAGFIIVFLLSSMGHFPIFMARFAVIIIGCLALFETATS